jgi:hypothetical protein
MIILLSGLSDTFVKTFKVFVNFFGGEPWCHILEQSYVNSIFLFFKVFDVRGPFYESLHGATIGSVKIEAFRNA